MIYVEKNAAHLPFTELIADINGEIKVIDSVSEVEDKKSNIIITAKRDNFCHACPATNNYRCCNYYVADIMQGCPYDCSYCILQFYLPHKYITVTADIDSVKESILALSKSKDMLRLGTGELSDSLALDHIVPLSGVITSIVGECDNIQFEFKTKSANVKNLLELNPKNIVVSWSLNPDSLISDEEPGTAPLLKRLSAARDCVKAGYKVGFHFDPLIMTDDFVDIYGTLIDTLHEYIDEKDIEFISVSTFRAPAELMDHIRSRPKDSILTKGDFIRGLDGKVRYFKPERIKMMRFVIERLRDKYEKTFIYLCMEHESLWNRLMGFDPKEREKFETLFPFYNKA